MKFEPNQLDSTREFPWRHFGIVICNCQEMSVIVQVTTLLIFKKIISRFFLQPALTVWLVPFDQF